MICSLTAKVRQKSYNLIVVRLNFFVVRFNVSTLYFACPQYLALASRRTGQAFYGKTYSLQGAAYNAFGAIGGKDSARPKAGKEAGEEFPAPHLGLLFGREGIEIDDIVLFRKGVGSEVCLYFV